MNTRKRTAVGVAVAGTAAGIAGLVVLATPAGAGEPPPALPPTTAEALVESVLAAEVPALSGTVELDENLGLPLPILPSGLAGGDGARVYSDGQGRGRITLTEHAAETTVVADDTTVWIWRSADRSVVKVPHDARTPEQAVEQLADPAAAAKQLVSAMQEDSTVIVDGTARVAGRPAYQLVLMPKPTEKTLLREIRVAVDAQTRVPLRLEVLANGQADPALKVGFTEFSPGPQDAGLFQFTPPPGATVTERQHGEHHDPQAAQDLFNQLAPQVVGQGWDCVLVARVPAEWLSAPAGGDGERLDAMALLRQFARQVSGTYGTGWVIDTKVGAALVTADGRVALGAVPEQVLVDALGQVK
jgi:outer membrane lipoprotein-sorting protein